MAPDGAGGGAAFWKRTSRKQLQTDSEAQMKQRGRKSHPYHLAGLTATLKASPALHPDREATRACKPGVGKQRDRQQGSRSSRTDTGAPQGAEEAGAKRVSPGVNSACTRQPLPGVQPSPGYLLLQSEGVPRCSGQRNTD